MILLPGRAAATIRDMGSFGRLALRVSEPDDLAVVSGISTKNGAIISVDPDRSRRLLNGCDTRPFGHWYRADPQLHVLWHSLRARPGTGVSLSAFKDWLRGPLQRYGAEGHLAVTYAPGIREEYPEVDLPDFAAWSLRDEGAVPYEILVEPDVTGVRQLDGHWPVKELQEVRILLVGAGSIGAATAHALAGYGVGHLTIVDPDRLAWHNLIRHTSPYRHIGRHKVTSLAEELQALRPDTAVVPVPLDVIAHADRIRALLIDTDIVVCAADGVAARRVTGHLARRARQTAIMACVLHDGAIGEVLRLRPWPQHGCLTCRRRSLTETGGLDPEPALDAAYGTGTVHRPMTAVGPDLHLVAHLAAKTAVATLLERHGHSAHRLPGEHALLDLQHQPDLAPPFDLHRTGDLRWLPATPPVPGCPTCESSA